jgi:bacteriocin biosynthesis cyclodehydratase domain-containing protein
MPPQHKLKALAVHVIDTDDGAIVKRGCTELKIGGPGAAETVRTVLAATSEGGATETEICGRFLPSAAPLVRQLIEQLLARHLLAPVEEAESAAEGQESPLDIFYWHFDAKAREVAERLNKRSFAILGVNYISRQLAASLAASGVENFRVWDHPRLRNLRFFDEAGRLKTDQWPASVRPPQEWMGEVDPNSFGCLIATSDFGVHETLYEWNRFCVEHRRHFLPVVLRDLIGYVGPLVIPGETACLECARLRRNSHIEDYEIRGLIEESAFEGQGAIGFHPSMASILGDIAALELTKFYSEVLPRPKIGTLIEVNLLETGLTSRKVLKAPRCPACSPLLARSSVSPDKAAVASAPG